MFLVDDPVSRPDPMPRNGEDQRRRWTPDGRLLPPARLAARAFQTHGIRDVGRQKNNKKNPNPFLIF